VIVKQQPPVVFAVGYSVRALVEAFWYAGFECVAVDHFGDADTLEFANDRWIQFQSSDRGLLSSDAVNAIQTAVTEFKRARKNAVFLLSGGMENLGGAVEQLRDIAPVIGPTEEQRRALRDIEFLHGAALVAGIQTPQLQYGEVSHSGWLWKPHSSAGGLKIVRSEFAAADSDPGYWQKFIRGEQIGVSCVIDPSRCQIIGATSSFDSAEWSGPSEFVYRGSIGPIALSAECQTQIEGMCDQIRASIGFFGWLQFDFIRDDRGALWLLECNPRWTAGMEIFLFARSVNPVRELLNINYLNNSIRIEDQIGKFACFAKAIVYATTSINLTDDLIAKLEQIESLADRPHAPQLIERGHPIATVRAGLKCDQASQVEAENRTRLLEELRERASRLEACLFTNTLRK